MASAGKNKGFPGAWHLARLANDRATELLLSDLRHWGVSERFIRVEDDGSTPIIVHRIARDAEGRATHSFSWRCASGKKDTQSNVDAPEPFG